MTVSKPYMFRRLSVLVLVTAFAFSCLAQPLMQKTIRADRPSMMFGSVIPEGNSYVVSGVTSNLNSPYYGRNFIGRLDEQGDFVTVRYFYDTVAKNYGNFNNSLIKCNTGYACAGYTADPIQKVLLSRYSEGLDSEQLNEYDSSNSYSYQGAYVLVYDEYFYITGGRTDQNIANPDLILMKVDNNGNKLWQKLYGDLLNWEGASSLIKLNNGNIMIGSFKRDLETPTETSNTWLLEVDTAGSIIRQWFDQNDSTYGAYGLKKTLDGGFIYAGQMRYLQEMHSIYSIGAVAKLDSNFNLQWRWTGGNPRDVTGLYDVEELADGSYIACGNNPYLNGTVMTGAWVVKLSASGELIWERHYSGSNYTGTENYLNDIDVLPNGNLVAVGETRDFSDSDRGQMGLLLVMDSNGCVIENCTVGIDDLEPKAQMKVYPNPFTDEVSISIQDAVMNDATVTVTNPLGQVLHQAYGLSLSDNYTVDLSGLSAGLYFIAIEAEGERIVKQVVKGD